jgi:hypothetical protein
LVASVLFKDFLINWCWLRNTENSVLNSPVSFASAAVSHKVCDPGCWDVLQDASTHILDQNEVPSDVLLLKGRQLVRFLLSHQQIKNATYSKQYLIIFPTYTFTHDLILMFNSRHYSSLQILIWYKQTKNRVIVLLYLKSKNICFWHYFYVQALFKIKAYQKV